MARARSSSNNSTANLGFEAKLWLAADKLRSNMDAAEYEPIVLRPAKSQIRQHRETRIGKPRQPC